VSRLFDGTQTGANETWCHTPSSSVYNNLAAVSISVWLKTPSTFSSYGVLVVKDPNTDYSPALAIGGGGGFIEAFTANDQAHSRADFTFSVNTWYNLVMTWDRNGDGKIRLYVDGTEVSSYSTQTAYTGSTYNDSGDGFYFGNDTFDEGWTGKLAEIAVWSKALTVSDISNLYASTSGAAGIESANLVGYWHLCGAASPEPDATANGNNATLSSNPPVNGGEDSPGYSCAPPPPLPGTDSHSVDAYISYPPGIPYVACSGSVSGAICNNPTSPNFTGPPLQVSAPCVQPGDIILAWSRNGGISNGGISTNLTDAILASIMPSAYGTPVGPTEVGTPPYFGVELTCVLIVVPDLNLEAGTGSVPLLYVANTTLNVAPVDLVFIVVRNLNASMIYFGSDGVVHNLNSVLQAASSQAAVGASGSSGILKTAQSDTLAIGCGAVQSTSPDSGPAGLVPGPGWSPVILLPQTLLEDPLIQNPETPIAATFSQSNPSFAWVAQLVLLRPSLPGVHYVDAYVVLTEWSYIPLAGNIIPPIPPNEFIQLAGTVLQPSISAVNLAGTINSAGISSVPLAGTLQSTTRNYTKLAGSIQNPTYRTHSVDCDVSVDALSFVQLVGTISGAVATGPCGSFPDASFVNLSGWIVAPGGSVQMPNSGFTLAEDFLSSQLALAAYKPISVFILNGIALIITAFTTGVQSWQTRTRSWLRRVDAAPNGILLTTKTNVHTLPNGAVVTTTTEVRQQQDTIVTIVTIQNSATPERTSVIVTEKNKYGQTTSREIDTVNINGVIRRVETKNVYSQPPTTENIQPLKVTTLDGVQHYQFFGQENTEWAGGDAEGQTVTTTNETITPGTLNGQTQDQFGNPILQKTTDETIQTPDGKTIETKTTVIGSQSDAGTTVTDTTSQFNGIQTTIHKVVTYPDGSQSVSDVTKNDLTGDSTEVDVETVTDEFGQVTVTTTTTETKTTIDPTTGQGITTETKTVVVNKGGVTTTDTQVDTTNDFEDDIVNQKIQVIYIQEFTLNVVIDEFSMLALWEINTTQQKNYALLELFSQQLSNATLSYALRQSLIEQFNAANVCVSPVELQANGRLYQVVFAPSASAFRAKYIPGTEPHVYELQMILQERSNLINGTKGFF
jgi:concanavalin A-like lectin/glucanase superfamily protein